MKQKKLTLSLDPRVVQAAKKWAENRETSLSQVVTNYFKELVSNPVSKEIDVWSMSFKGLLPKKTIDEKELKKGRIEELERKHR